MENQTNWPLAIIVSIVSGVCASAFAILFTCLWEKRNQKKEFLEKQLQNLYGPLYWLIVQNEILFDLQKRVMTAYDSEYCNVQKEYSNNEHTQKVLKEEISAAISVGNEYIDRVEPNKEEILRILNENSSCIDVDDMDFFKFSLSTKLD